MLASCTNARIQVHACVRVCFSWMLINVEMSTCALQHLVLRHAHELRLAFRSDHLQAGRGHTQMHMHAAVHTYTHSFLNFSLCPTEKIY